MTDTMVHAIKSITARDAGLGVIWFLGVLAPGFLTVFHFLPEIAQSYEFLKLILLSASLSLPVLSANLVVCISITRKKDHSELPGHWFDASLASIVASYISLYIAYYFSLSFPNFVLILAGIDLPLAIFMAILSRSAD